MYAAKFWSHRLSRALLFLAAAQGAWACRGAEPPVATPVPSTWDVTAHLDTLRTEVSCNTPPCYNSARTDGTLTGTIEFLDANPRSATLRGPLCGGGACAWA